MQRLLIEATMPALKQSRDKNLDHPAVIKHRDIIHLRANHIQREEIVSQVGNSERNLRLWEAVLVEWMLCGNNPKNVMGMLKALKVMIDGVINSSRL